jgi:uncharacterized protein (UPF0332 family)
MSFNWENYKTIAEHLHDHPYPSIEEACYRTTISRAYYAAFHVTQQKMIKRYRFNNLTVNAHTQLLEFLKEKKKDNPIIKDAWKNLKRLRDQREDADYDGELNFTGQEGNRSAIIAIEYCNKIIDAISQLRN